MLVRLCPEPDALKVFKAVHPSKQESGTDAAVDQVTDVKLAQPAKAPSPTWVTFAGTVIRFKATLPATARSYRQVT